MVLSLIDTGNTVEKCFRERKLICLICLRHTEFEGIVGQPDVQETRAGGIYVESW